MTAPDRLRLGRLTGLLDRVDTLEKLGVWPTEEHQHIVFCLNHLGDSLSKCEEHPEDSWDGNYLCWFTL